MEGKEESRESCQSVQESVAYEYLCHLQEAKLWMESILKDSLPPVKELEENLRNGVYLARIGNVIAPKVVPLSRVYDIFQHRYRAHGLRYQYTDNINYWIKALDAVNFPKVFHPETTDIYEKKNMPKVIYCIHALSVHLFKLGKAPSIQDLYGKLKFNRDELNSTCHELQKYGSNIPSFENINGILINESDCDQFVLNSFIKETDEAVSSGCDLEKKKNEEIIVIDEDLERRIILLQSHVRGYLKRQEIRRRTKPRLRNQPIKSRVKGKGGKTEDEVDNGKLSVEYIKHVDKIIKIQSLWRGYRVRKTLKINHTKFVILRRMVLTHQMNGHEYSEQYRLQTLRSSVLETIKKNQELSSKLDEIDTKIGLLVHNRILIQNIGNDGNGVGNKLQPKGIKTFNKEAKTLLDGYRQLFYILQTDPIYLTRLITRQSQKSTHVIQSCILSLFNYGSSSRDAYLLLRLFRTALVEEVKCKFQKPIDVIKENPLVLRLALGFSRQYGGYDPLRNILGSLIESVLKEKTYIETNPVEIYRRWLNKMETETGESHNHPTTVTREEALSHPEVAERLKHNLKILKMWVKAFSKRISVCADEFPYALRFIAKILWNALKEKFPEASEKDILKIVGNLVFYQYINTAIVAPDTFYLISLPPGQQLKPEQRRNLASIAKILQSAACKTGFGMESQHLMCLNSFIISCHEEMKLFCRKCCTVEDLEEHYGITKYTEAALIEKPKIHITFEEMCECHKLLHEESRHISNNPFDPIQEVLDALGDPPSVADLVGCSPEEAASSRAGKKHICLELDNRFQLPPEDPTEAEKLFIKTKELIISRISDLKGTSLKESIAEDHSDIAYNLMQLELMGMVKSSDDYSAIIESIITDIRQKQRYQQNLNKEMKILRVAEERLNEKRKYYEDQLSYYEQYLNTCLNNLTRPSKKTGEHKIRSKKYSATKLMEMGVLVSLDGVPSSQLKNVKFEIEATELNGIYTVRGRFMGVEVDKMNLDVQDLLQHQFEGQSVMNLFGKAKVNVNLLLHLINKKFHLRS